MDNEYTYKKVEGGYRVFAPTGQPIALLACSLAAVEVVTSCHQDRRMPTPEEQKILFPKQEPGNGMPVLGNHGNHCTAVVYGNRVFVRHGKPDTGKESH